MFLKQVLKQLVTNRPRKVLSWYANHIRVSTVNVGIPDAEHYLVAFSPAGTGDTWLNNGKRENKGNFRCSCIVHYPIGSLLMEYLARR